MKIKILKDYAAGKAGEIKEANFPGGDQQEYVDNGFIEIIKDNNKDNNNLLSVKEIINRLVPILEMTPL